jgi:hypothetical protein
VVGDAEDQEGAVVVGGDARAAVFVGGGENGGGDFDCGLLRRNTREDVTKAVRAELFCRGVCGFEDAVGGEKNRVAGDEIENDFVVLGIRKQAEGNACDANRLDHAIANEQGIGTAGVGSVRRRVPAS